MMQKPKRTFDPSVDDQHWQALFDQHFQDLQGLNAISTLWINGFSKLGIDNSKRPSAESLTQSIASFTGYTFIQTDTHLILDQRDWYGMIADYKMPLTCFLRTPAELSYCDEPDIWHDIMGHIPFLAEQTYSDMYQLLARTYNQAFDKGRSDVLPALDFIGGMLIELGLVRETHGIKAFGSTFYSSSEVKLAFEPTNQITFTEASLHTGETYDRHSFQGKYYIFDSLEQLVMIIENLARKL
jgi:phenylalanine-4-hydroxylase